MIFIEYACKNRSLRMAGNEVPAKSNVLLFGFLDSGPRFEYLRYMSPVMSISSRGRPIDRLDGAIDLEADRSESSYRPPSRTRSEAVPRCPASLPAAVPPLIPAGEERADAPLP